MRKKICVITGTRADYGILVPVMKAIKYSKKFDLHIIATGMHLMEEFGYTVKEIARDGFKVYKKLNISYKKDTGFAMASSVGKAVSVFSETFSELKPDMVVILGDRGEMLAAAISANYMNIPVAHIHGGEISGHIDGILRHAITKLAHIHFPASQQAKERILKLGEEPDRIFIAGAPALDRILKETLPSAKELSKKYKIDMNRPFVLLAQHPVSTEVNKAKEQIEIVLRVLKKLKLQTIVIYPNADAGGREMIKSIRKYRKYSFIKLFKSIPHKDYLGLMKHASVLIGNSSSGIIEAPAFKLPVVNIGIRQAGRERAVNVIDVSFKKSVIEKAVKKAIYNRNFKKRLKKCRNPYGDGYASERIAKVLTNIKLDEKLLEKRITY